MYGHSLSNPGVDSICLRSVNETSQVTGQRTGTRGTMSCPTGESVGRTQPDRSELVPRAESLGDSELPYVYTSCPPLCLLLSYDLVLPDPIFPTPLCKCVYPSLRVLRSMVLVGAVRSTSSSLLINSVVSLQVHLVTHKKGEAIRHIDYWT